jgi:hypothetical protein
LRDRQYLLEHNKGEGCTQNEYDDHDRHEQRQGDVPEPREGPCPVDRRGLVELRVDALKRGVHKQYCER